MLHWFWNVVERLELTFSLRYRTPAPIYRLNAAALPPHAVLR